MKKSLMILASVALGASMSVGQDVESKNVVGFNAVTLPLAQYTPLGWQFALVGGNTNVPIASITNYADPKTGLGFSSADGIRRFNSASSTWTDYFRSSTGWKLSGGDGTVTTNSLVPGEMVMFIKRTTASTISQSGEVIAQNVLIPLPLAQYRAMCNPFPVETPIASITNYPDPKTGLGFSSADGIRRFNSASSTWTDYFRSSTGWKLSGGDGTVTTNTIPPGEGFMFIKRTTASTITFETPL